jgi:hypothetical protein
MKRTNLVWIALVVLGIGSGCKGPDKGEISQGPANITAGNPELCKSNCEGTAYMKVIPKGDWNPITLQPEESISLKNTLKSTKASGPEDKIHIHADAVNDRVVFSSEVAQDPAHVSGAEPEIAVGTSNPPNSSIAVRVVASPAATKLLQERAMNRPN